MSISRRQALLAGGAIGLQFGFGADATAQQGGEPEAGAESLVDEAPPLPESMRPYAGFPDLVGLDLDTQPLGTQRPTTHEVQLAARIMSASPHGTRRPLDVARFFRDVGQGGFNATAGEDVRHYVRGWPVRYNPVIINLFRATGTNPLSLDADFTAWCAAFVNWCVARAHSDQPQIALNDRGLMERFPAPLLQRGTGSASSGSFRCWSSARNGSGLPGTPVPGDVIVWAIRGSVSGCAPGKGHVGFFTGRAPDGRYRTLGGNQMDRSIGHSAVVEKLFPASFSRSDGTCLLHSIRQTTA